MIRKRPGLLRHIAELILQNKSLTAENEKLNRQYELLAHEVHQYKELLSRTGTANTSGLGMPEKSKSVVRYKTATVLFADAFGFENFSGHTNSKLLVDSLDEIFIMLQNIASKYEIRNINNKIIWYKFIINKFYSLIYNYLWNKII